MRHVPVGYVPELARIAPANEDIDVLFYVECQSPAPEDSGSAQRAGPDVVTLFGTYGEQRDHAIARAKVVLSVHYYGARSSKSCVRPIC